MGLYPAHNAQGKIKISENIHLMPTLQILHLNKIEKSVTLPQISFVLNFISDIITSKYV